MISGFFRKIFLILLIPLKISAQTYTSYYSGNHDDTITRPEGGICLMGGATEHDEAMKWFLRRSCGGDVLVVETETDTSYIRFVII